MDDKPFAWASEQLLFYIFSGVVQSGTQRPKSRFTVPSHTTSLRKISPILDMSSAGFRPSQQIKALATELCKFALKLFVQPTCL